MSNFKILLLASVLFVSACSSPDLGTKIAATGVGTLAQDQRVSGRTFLMEPRIEDLTSNTFNIRYIEISFGGGTPRNVRDMAIEQCSSMDKVAVYKTTSRGLVQMNTVKAYYECIAT